MSRILQAPDPILRLHCGLGESMRHGVLPPGARTDFPARSAFAGPVWDSRTLRLYFVDIVKKQVWTYEPSSGIHGFETFEEPITCIALRQAAPGVRHPRHRSRSRNKI